jgi:hypothetical protein
LIGIDEDDGIEEFKRRKKKEGRRGVYAERL